MKLDYLELTRQCFAHWDAGWARAPPSTSLEVRREGLAATLWDPAAA